MNLITQIIITIFGAFLSYLASIKNTKSEVEKEIKKIETEYKNQIEKIKAETDEQIKLEIAKAELNSKGKEDDIKYEAMGGFIKDILKNPSQATQKMKDLQKLSKSMSTKKRK